MHHPQLVKSGLWCYCGHCFLIIKSLGSKLFNKNRVCFHSLPDWANFGVRYQEKQNCTIINAWSRLPHPRRVEVNFFLVYRCILSQYTKCILSSHALTEALYFVLSHVHFILSSPNYQDRISKNWLDLSTLTVLQYTDFHKGKRQVSLGHIQIFLSLLFGFLRLGASACFHSLGRGACLKLLPYLISICDLDCQIYQVSFFCSFIKGFFLKKP